jgi:hypothetical protein
MKMANFIIKAICFICFLAIVWVAISFFDIITHNLDGMKNCGKYLDWNFFIIFLNKFGR